MPRDQLCVRDLHTFGLKGAQRGEGRGHQSGLGILRQREGFNFALPDQRAQLFAQGFVDFVKHGFCGWIGFGQSAAHADGLGTLPWKYECAAHVAPLIVVESK